MSHRNQLGDRWSEGALGRILLASACPFLVEASAAPLDVTAQTLLEQVNRQRDARDLPWDPSTGRLGNLRHVNIVAPDCTVRVVSGTENRLYAGWGSVRVSDSPRVPDREGSRGPTARDLTLTFVSGATNPALPRIGDASGPGLTSRTVRKRPKADSCG